MRPTRAARLTLLAALVLMMAGCGGAKREATRAQSGAGGAQQVDALQVATGSSPAMEEDRPAEKAARGGDVMPPPLPPGTSVPVNAALKNRRIIQNADLELEVDSASRAESTVRTLVAQAGGVVTDANFSRNELAAEGRMTARIPAEAFASFLDRLAGVGDVRNRRIYTEDVTEQYVDLEAHLGNLEAQERRLREILSKAGTVDEILRVEAELTRVRAEADSLKGRLQLLRNQAELSTVNLHIRETLPPAHRLETRGLTGLGGRMARAFTQGANAALDLVALAVVGTAGFLPLAALLAVVALVLFLPARALRARLSQRRPS